MSRDRIVDDYLNGELPFSAIYREASRDEVCPEDVAARVRARAARWSRLWPALAAARRVRRGVRSLVERHPILAGVALAIAVAALSLAVANLRTAKAPDAAPVLECPGPSTEDGSGITPAR